MNKDFATLQHTKTAESLFFNFSLFLSFFTRKRERKIRFSRWSVICNSIFYCDHFLPRLQTIQSIKISVFLAVICTLPHLINVQLSSNNVGLSQKFSLSIFFYDAIAHSAKYIHQKVECFYPITEKSNVAKLNRYKCHRSEVECFHWRIIEFATMNSNCIVHFYDSVMYPIFLFLSSSLFTPPTHLMNLQLSPNDGDNRKKIYLPFSCLMQ